MRPALTDLTRRLTDRDLAFVVRATSTRRTDFDRIRDIIKDKPDFLEILLEDDRVYRRMQTEGVLLEVSPQLLFAVLLRRARRLLKETSFTLEARPEGDLPVFDARRAARLVEHPRVLDYLSDMLASFVRTESRAFVVRRGSVHHRRVLSDMDVHDLFAVAEMVEPEQRFAVFKRLADLSLFMVGLFPEHTAQASATRASSGQGHPGGTRRRQPAGVLDTETYELIGTEFYHRAAEDPAAQRTGLAPVMEMLGDHFPLAAKPLYVLGRHLIPLQRWTLFGKPPVSPGRPPQR